MPHEIERKFLVTGEGWRDALRVSGPGRSLVQAYLTAGDKASVRIRIVGGREAFLTVKSAGATLTRAEFEYPVPVTDAQAMLPLCRGKVIEKTRHRLPAGGGLTWEIDVFAGAHAGLVIAEIELPTPDTPFARPDWLGEEVTGDPAYGNAALAAG